MKKVRSYRLAVFVSFMLMAGCSPGLHVTDQVQQEDHVNEIRRTLPRDEVSAILASGFYTISERALSTVSVRQLGLEGMRGLATIDPEISIVETDGVIKVWYGDQWIKSVIEPLAYDSESWADAVYEVVQAVWLYSSDVAATNAERIYEAVFDAALSNLDIFSRYAGSHEAEGNRDRREGFGGLNMTLHKIDERFLVNRVDRDGPAYEAGVRKGDMLIMVNNEAVIGHSLHDVNEMLRGKVQTEVALQIERPSTGITQEVFAWRELVIAQTVWADYDDGVLTLRVARFNEKTLSSLSQDIEDAVLMHGEALKGIVLDLRGNPGGLLKRAVQVADLFISGGRIISTTGRHPDSFEIFEADPRDITNGRPVVVLLNGKSASASEIVAAALQDRQRAVIVGSSSYGKGTVQSVQRLPNDGEITITWSRLVAPSGYSFHGLGVRPSVCTSGIKYDKDRGPALSESNGSDLLTRWRTVGLDDRQGRKQLRQTCRPDSSKKEIDMAVARNLVLDPGLYQRFTGSTTLATLAQ